MALVPAKCTQCGSNIEVDATKEAGICRVCGTAFITEKAITNYNTYITNNNNFAGANINVTGANADNLVKMAENAIAVRNGKEAIDYANRALEINPELSKAWLMKMKAIEFIETIDNPKIEEVIVYGDNAIKYAEDKEATKTEVFTYYVLRAFKLMILSRSKLSDVEKIKRLAEKDVLKKKDLQKDDNEFRISCFMLVEKAVLLKLKIDEKYIEEHIYMQKNIVTLVNIFVSICKTDVERISIYGLNLLPSAIEVRQSWLESLKKGLPEDKIKEINDEDVKKNNLNYVNKNYIEKNNKKGCYIATCVYGSYDCPQVWTLRRFRDYTLDKTWYGRIFIKCYYTISPTVVKWFGETIWFKMFWKATLDKVVTNLNCKGVDDSYYNDKY